MKRSRIFDFFCPMGIGKGPSPIARGSMRSPGATTRRLFCCFCSGKRSTSHSPSKMKVCDSSRNLSSTWRVSKSTWNMRRARSGPGWACAAAEFDAGAGSARK
ncbi:MAG TPA: hypothetical protein PL072_08510 [Phycisphaerales bacterium]|nr:hypothetical protein [Phycisphaerales bacterium]